MKKNYFTTANQLKKTQLIHKNNAKRKREENLIDASFNVALLLSAWALRQEFDFGGRRLEKYVDKCLDVLDSYSKGYVSISDLNTAMKEETGIDFMSSFDLQEENYRYKE